MNRELPVAPPMVVDYRHDGDTFHPVGIGDIHPGHIGLRRPPFTFHLATPSTGANVGPSCLFDIDCDDCDACTIDACAEGTCSGGDRPGFPCTGDNECTGGGTCVPLAFRQCVNVAIPAGAASSGCDDGLACNGFEFCEAGVCVDGTDDLCSAFPQRVCDETTDTCVLPCQNDGDCDDGALCNGTERCDLTTGLCLSDGINPCGPGASCQEPGPGQTVPTCGLGRCCDAAGNCSRVTFADCTNLGGRWLAVGLSNTTCADTPCPIYSSGLAGQGTFTVSVGPISNSPCDPLRIGDDYTVDSGGGPVLDFIDVTAVRFVGGAVREPARVSVEFWDAGGVFIEDIFLPNDIGVGPAVRTLILDPPLTVPAQGRVTFTVAANFDPNDRLALMATDAVDVGANDASLMFVNGMDASNFLKKCQGGSRNDRWCSPFGNASVSEQACINGGGSCVAVPDRLAFEIIASPSTTPQGACCDPVVGACSVELPWVCEAAGKIFQGTGTFCKSCSNDLRIGCVTVTDCPPKACVGGNQAGQVCTNDSDCVGGGTCSGTPICNPVPPACTVQACCVHDPSSFPPISCFSDADCVAVGLRGPCDTGTGLCRISVGECVPLQGFCAADSTIPCARDADCTGAGPCVNSFSATNACLPGTVSRGFGCSCQPNCCGQSTSSGGDSCLDAPVTQITVPPVGEVATVTITGSNASATSNDYNLMVCQGGPLQGSVCTGDADCNGGTCTGRLCDLSIFDPQGDVQDPSWFEAFQLDACANVRIDLCCSDPTVLPAWGFLIDGCPCGNIVTPTGVEPPVGFGLFSTGAARGGPVCADDNLWMTFGPLPAGTYLYPIFSAPGSSLRAPPGGTYQLHLTVSRCQKAACCHLACSGGAFDGLSCTSDADCTGGLCASACLVTDELECRALNGFWLAGANIPMNQPNIIDCVTSPCSIGSCCLGPGQCEDRAIPPTACDPSLAATCMDKGVCDTLGGRYVGGAGCNFPVDACPVCTAQNDESCQFPNGQLAYDVDQFGLLGNVRVADDFVTVGTEIRQLCWWPVKFNPITEGPCDAAAPEQWRIRFYKDTGGLPGLEIPGSPGPVTLTAQAPFSGLVNGFQYSVVFDPPIDVQANARYWVEISATGVQDQCALNVAGSADGNGWSLWDVDGANWTQEDRNRILDDIAFCIDTGDAGMDIPPPQTGACCGCGGICIDGLRAEECLGFLTPAGDPTGTTIGEWSIGRTCGEITCSTRIAPGDDCDSPIPVLEGANPVSTQCATTDGRTSLNCDDGTVISTIESDVWLTYTATCTGRVLFDYCGDIDFDGIMAVFTDISSTCPSTCPPPLLSLVAGQCNDLGCNTIRGGAVVQTVSLTGQCFKIRIASDSPGQRGQGNLNVNCIPIECIASDPPQPDLAPNVFGTLVENVKNRFLSFTAGNANRRQAIRVTFDALPGVFAVFNGQSMWAGPIQRVSTLPGKGFLCSADPGCVPNPPIVPCCLGSDPFLTLSKLQAEPFYQDWTVGTSGSADGFIHVYGDKVIPGGTYRIQVIDETCNPNVAQSFSAPSVQRTSPRWADMCSPGSNGACIGPPNLGQPDVDVLNDLLGVLKAFGGSVLTKPQADLQGIDPLMGVAVPDLDGTIDIGEVTATQNEFSTGRGYPFAPPPARKTASTP